MPSATPPKRLQTLNGLTRVNVKPQRSYSTGDVVVIETGTQSFSIGVVQRAGRRLRVLLGKRDLPLDECHVLGLAETD